MSPTELLRNIDAYWGWPVTCRLAKSIFKPIRCTRSRSRTNISSHDCWDPGRRRRVSTSFRCISTRSSTFAYVSMIYIFGPGHGGPSRRVDQIAVLTVGVF
jgi:hypothetical protein